MGRLTVLTNDEEILSTDFQSQEKILGSKIDFPIFGCRAITFFCANKVTNIQIVTHPYLGRLSKNVLEVLHNDIANLARYRKCIFLIWDPNID